VHTRPQVWRASCSRAVPSTVGVARVTRCRCQDRYGRMVRQDRSVPVGRQRRDRRSRHWRLNRGFRRFHEDPRWCRCFDARRRRDRRHRMDSNGRGGRFLGWCAAILRTCAPTSTTTPTTGAALNRISAARTPDHANSGSPGAAALVTVSVSALPRRRRSMRRCGTRHLPPPRTPGPSDNDTAPVTPRHRRDFWRERHVLEPRRDGRGSADGKLARGGGVVCAIDQPGGDQRCPRCPATHRVIRF
jgi:hypothetical protein